MRTLQEKYTGVLEGNFSKTQFLRDARMAQPQFITQYNSFEDAVQILKNKGMVTEAKVETPKYSTAKPEDLISPDVLDTGIKFELDKKFGTLDVSEEDYKKARAAAIKNLSKDVLYYVSQDSTQLETPKEEMQKVKLSEATEKFSQIIKTILEAEEDFEEAPEAEEAPASDYSHLANALKAAYEADGENTDNMTFEQTCADSLENGEVKVCFDALKGGNVIDEFTFLVSPDQGVKIETFSNTTDLGQMDDSVDSLSARIVNHWDSLQAPVEEGHGENPEKFKEADAFDPTKFYIKDLKSGRILNAVSVQGSKLILHYDTEADAQAQADWITRWEGDPGRFEVLPGTDPEVEALVNKQIGVEENIKEGLDYETLEYMEGQVNIKAVDALIAAARIIIRDLEDFDQEDVFEFLVDRLRTLEPIRESK